MSDTDRASLKTRLEDRLFGSAGFPFAILDGARHLDTLAMLEESGVPHLCLYTGRLDPEVAVTAPYLVELREEDDLFDRLFDEGWGDSRGIFLLAEQKLRALRLHLKTLAYAEMPDGEVVLFRFYDPRALRAFMPVATPEQRAAMFGEAVDAFLLEDETGEEIVTYENVAG